MIWAKLFRVLEFFAFFLPGARVVPYFFFLAMGRFSDRSELAYLSVFGLGLVGFGSVRANTSAQANVSDESGGSTVRYSCAMI